MLMKFSGESGFKVFNRVNHISLSRGRSRHHRRFCKERNGGSAAASYICAIWTRRPCSR
jgi:hypothetical protein